MSSFLRRLRSTTRLHSPRSEPPPSSGRADSHLTPSPSFGSPRPSSPTKLRQGPARRGYEALEGDQLVSNDSSADDLGTALAVGWWTLDEGAEGGELGDWVWIDLELARAATACGNKDLVSVGGARSASLPTSDNDVAPPLVPFSPPYALSPERDPPRTPTKRKASISSPELSPTASFSSALLSPSSPISRTSTSSLAPPPTPNSPTPSVSLSLTIATRIDHNGRRVLTSRRRLSLKPSPCETRRHKDLYGVGDDDEVSGGEEDDGDDVRFATGSAGLELVEAGSTIRAPGMGLGMLDVDVFAAHGRSTSSPPMLPASSFEARPARPRPAALQPLVIPPSGSPRHYESPLPSPTLARLPEHQPIKTFWPPPPLDPPSSPTKSSAFSSLTRSNTTYSSRTSSSSSANGSSSVAKRHNSLLQPRRTFRRLSLSSRHGSAHGGAGSGAAPLMSATTFSSLHERRASAPALDGVDLERHTSMSSLGSTSGSGAFSIPPTPGATSSSSHFSLGTGASCSTSEPLLALVRQQSLSSGASGPSAHARRASQVSFELPPSTPSEARRAAASSMSAGTDDGHAAGSSASASSALGSHPPLSPSSSFARARRHARSASEGGSALQMSVLERSWVPLEDQAERELARGTLIVRLRPLAL